ncbi:unnamed protein product [Clonostachys rosea]|uniref:P-type ATPase A domain-containing protein n=1 Tax=Bionectria ochroleuca TaxID=29856 RepID=A0ABY6URG7_BIOOC|nr:unnamed protein product [Clonostachys rosea]
MVSPGDRLVVLQGDQIPCDGIVDGQDETMVLEAWMNGSNIPHAVKCGDTVFAGSRVEHGRLNFRVQSCGRSTRLGKILDSVLDAEVMFPETPPGNHIQHFVTAYLLLTTVVCVGQLWYTPNKSSVDMLGRASAMLLAACPCVLSLSLPTVKLLATVRASKGGVRLTTKYNRIKNVASAGVILFDKTGTLTNGLLQISHVIECHNWDLSVWSAIRQLEDGFQHPVALAISREAEERLKSLRPGLSADLARVTEILSETGRGVRGTVTFAGRHSWSGTLAIGSRRYIESLGIHVSLAAVPTELRNAVTTSVIVAINGAQAGILILQDNVRPDAGILIRELKRSGIRVGMVTGDNHASAMAVSHHVGIDNGMVFSDCLPQEKALIVKRFRRRAPTIFVGDNLNDIPSFASASFSIFVPGPDMCSSTKLYIADATLTPSALNANIADDGTLSRILFLIRLSRRMRQIISQNIWWAVMYNTIALLLTSGSFGGVNYSPSSVRINKI